jgi:hypothetical protein
MHRFTKIPALTLTSLYVINTRKCHLEPSFPLYLKAAYTDKDKRPRLVWDDVEAETEEQ